MNVGECMCRRGQDARPGFCRAAQQQPPAPLPCICSCQWRLTVAVPGGWTRGCTGCCAALTACGGCGAGCSLAGLAVSAWGRAGAAAVASRDEPLMEQARPVCSLTWPSPAPPALPRRLAMHMVGSSPAELNIRHLCGVALHVSGWCRGCGAAAQQRLTPAAGAALASSTAAPACWRQGACTLGRHPACTLRPPILPQAAASALGLALRVLLSQVPYAFLCERGRGWAPCRDLGLQGWAVCQPARLHWQLLPAVEQCVTWRAVLA